MSGVLITGFEPFGGDPRNPSGEIARLLDGRSIAGRRVVGVELPCAFGRSRRRIETLLDAHRQELVVSIGLAANRAEITPERVAINVSDARIADNDGRRPVERPVIRGGPAGYWSTLPVRAIVRSLNRAGFPAAISNTAGTYVCNHVFFATMHVLRRRRTRAGFIHIPWPSDWAGKSRSTMTFAEMVRAVELAVRVSLRGIRRARAPDR